MCVSLVAFQSLVKVLTKSTPKQYVPFIICVSLIHELTDIKRAILNSLLLSYTDLVYTDTSSGYTDHSFQLWTHL